MEKDLTVFEAYTAMYEFLGELYDTMHNDTLGAILENMRLQRSTGLPANPVMKDGWQETVRIAGLETQPISWSQAWSLMTEFVRRLCLQLPSPHTQDVIAYLALREHDPEVIKDWKAAISLAAQKYENW